MTKNDQQLLAEAYHQIEEGMWDRLKARGSQAVGAVKGAGKQIKGTAKELAGDVLSKTAELGGQAFGVDTSKGGLAKKGAELTKGGKEDTAGGKAAGQEAKYASYIKNSANTIVNDLNKLGMEVADPDALNQELQKLVSKHLTQVSAQGNLKRDVSGMKRGVDRIRAKYAGKKVGPQNRGTRTNVNEPLPDV